MEQQNLNMMPPMPPKKKSKKKIWIWVAVFVFIILPLLSAIFGDSDKEESKDAVAKTEEVKDSVVSKKPKKDLIKAKQLETKFIMNVDEFKGLAWVEPKSKPKYSNTTGIYSYFALKDSIPENMRLRIQYGADDWLFIKSYTFLIDGKTYEFSNPKMERDNNSNIWEWSDTNVFQDLEIAEIYARLLTAKEAKIRFNGRQYHSDYTIPQSTLQSIRDTRDYYLALGGE